MTEAELAAQVVAHLEAEHRDVYQEVKIRSHDGIADIVAKTGPVLWVLECKMHFSLDLIAQAHEWLWYAHLVSVVVPEPIQNTKPGKWPRRAKHEHFVQRVLQDYGIGLLYYKTRHVSIPELHVEIGPDFRRPRMAYRLAEALCQEQKTFAKAGSPNGSVWSPFQHTCARLAEYVKAHPGVTLREAVEHAKHHYCNDKSAIGSLRHWIDAGKVRGVEMRPDGRRLTLYPSGVVDRSDEETAK